MKIDGIVLAVKDGAPFERFDLTKCRVKGCNGTLRLHGGSVIFLCDKVDQDKGQHYFNSKSLTELGDKTVDESENNTVIFNSEDN